MNVDERIQELLVPLQQELATLIEERTELMRQVAESTLAIKRIDKVLQMLGAYETPKKPPPLKKKVSDKKADYALLMIEEHIEDRETAFTSGELQQWANISQSTAGEILRVLRNREKIRLIGRVRADGQMGQAPYGYQLMP